MRNNRIFSVLILIALLLNLAACGGQKTVSRENQIPQNGIVSAEMFQTLKESGDLAIFSGEENGIAYRWTFIGTDIAEPEDADLRVHVAPSLEPAVLEALGAKQAIGFSFADARPKPGKPTLEITVGSGWESGSATVCTVGEEPQPRLICDAVIGEQTVAFAPSEYEGIFYLVLKAPPEATAPPEPAVTTEPSGKPAESTPQPEDAPAPTVKPAASEAPERAPAPGGQQPPAEATQPPAPEPPHQPTVSLSIRCDMALKNYDRLDSSVRDDRIVPPNGQILYATDIPLGGEESVFDILQRTCMEHKIHMESTYTPIRKSAYIEGINNLYEFSCGPLSGWMYNVNGWYPNYGCSMYKLQDGDVIEWNYTCDLGRDLGQYGVVQQTRD